MPKPPEPTTAQFITQSDFARTMNISRQSIQQAKKRGHIGMEVKAGGKVGSRIDLQSPLTQRYIRDCKERSLERKADGVPLGAQALEMRRRADQEYEERTESVQKAVKDALPVGREAHVKDKKQLEKEVLIQRRISMEVKTAQMRKTLVARDLVEQFFAEMVAILTSQLLTLPQKLSSEVAAALGSSTPEDRLKAEQTLQEEIFPVMDHLKRNLSEFLEEIEEQ